MKKYKTLLMKSLIVLLLALLFLSFIPWKVSAQEPSTIGCVDYGEYLDSDFFLNDDSYTIQDYTELIGLNFFCDGISNTTYIVKESTTDDFVTEIVPKELFFTLGNNTFMGQEYGFFINTELVANSNVYLSTVMVFDIIVSTNLVQTIDRAITTITPIFQYKYLGVQQSLDSIYIDDITFLLQINENCVIPYPKVKNGVLCYEMVERYYIKDVSFGASLYNEQTLNRGDEGYNPYQDYGSYFTGFDYSYRGRHRVHGEYPTEDLLWNMSDTVVYVLGFLDIVPVIGSATAILGQIYGGSQLSYNWVSFISDATSSVIGEIEQTTKKITATCYYQNRDDQLSQYKDKNGVPFLVKTAALKVDTTDDDTIWYGVGDDVTSYFNIGHSALDGRVPEYTRFTNQIVLKIVDTEPFNPMDVSGADVIISRRMRNPNYRDLDIDEPENIYLLPDGENYFSFKPDFLSDYTININSSVQISVLVDNQVYTGTNLSIQKRFEKGVTTKIKVYGNTNGVYTPIVVSPRNVLSGFSTPTQSEYLLKLDNIEGIKALTTANGVVIDKLYYSDGDGLKLYEDYGAIVPYDKITYPFKTQDNVYYALLRNNSTTVKNNCSLIIEEIPTVDLNAEAFILKLNNNFTYYKITVPTSGQYVQTVSNVVGNDYKYKVLNSSLENVVNGYSYTAGEYILSFDQGKTYYVGLTTGSIDNYAKIKIRKRENAYSWEITGGIYQNYKTFEREIFLARGNTYNVSFLINDAICVNSLFSEDDPHNFYGGYNIAVTSTGELLIPITTPVLGGGIEVKALYGNDLSYNHTLHVIPQFEQQITDFSMYNNERIGCRFTASKYVEAYDYTITTGKLVKSFSNQQISNYTNDSNVVDVDITNKFDVSICQPGAVQIKITMLYVSTAVGETVGYSCNYTMFVHNMFQGGLGTSSNPYVISYTRHLNNVRYATSSYYSIDKNLQLSGKFAPIYSFSGFLEGNNKIINNLNIEENDSSSSDSVVYCGMFRKVSGTIQNLNLTNVSITVRGTKKFYVGSLTGNISANAKIYKCEVYSLISESANIIDVRGSSNTIVVGGLVAYIQGGVIEKSRFSGKIYTTSNGTCEAGGLVGRNTSGNVFTSWTSGSVEINSSGSSSYLNVGGLIGRNVYNSSTGPLPMIRNCYSTANVWADCTGSSSYVYTGGLSGILHQSRVQYCYATGNVTGKNYVGTSVAGGFAADISDCASGGLVTYVFSAGDVYSRGNYSGAESAYSYFGHFCGSEKNNEFWQIFYNKDAKFKEGNTGKEITWNTSWYNGKTVSQLKSLSFQVDELELDTDIWSITSGRYPLLK